MPTPDETRVLKALKKLGEGDRLDIAGATPVNWLDAKKAEYLCHYLRRQGLVREVGRENGRNRYALTPKGQTILGRH